MKFLQWTAGLAVLAAGVSALTAVAQKPVRIVLAGDSTVTRDAGWSEGFCANVIAAVDCLDLAKGGVSSKTYRADGYWARALAAHPDYLLLQLGHNDVTDPKKPMPRNTTLDEYIANMRAFVTEARAAGIEPVLVTSIAREYFQPDGKIHDDLDAHVAAVKTIAAEMHVPLIDLHADSEALLEKTGPKAQAMWGRTKVQDGKTMPDKTHWNVAGSYVMGRIVATDMAKAVPALAAYVKPKAVSVPAGSPVTLEQVKGTSIVLVGDSTTAPGGGWGPGFCARFVVQVKCTDLALNGRSSKSFIDEGAWAKAVAAKGSYYLIQFGHNDEKPKPDRHTDPQTTFAENMRRMVREVKAQGGVPVLLSPLARRTFKDGKPSNADLRLYGDASKAVAAEEGVPYLDLLTASEALLAKGTQEDADTFNAVGHPDEKAENAGKAKPKLDRTHLNPYGQAVFGKIVEEEFLKLEPQLKPDLAQLP
ncbi:MAG: GDSL-type esterase/lipase family protein [Acidobacteriaceae bacterium]|nr:GDSL-type esterase/lipase family protein [Acidobacteriaceae bacterium]